MCGNYIYHWKHTIRLVCGLANLFCASTSSYGFFHASIDIMVQKQAKRSFGFPPCSFAASTHSENK